LSRSRAGKRSDVSASTIERGIGQVAKMSGDAVSKERIFYDRACTDIVNDHIPLSAGNLLITDQSDMRQIVAQTPRHNIAGSIVLGAITDRERLSMTSEEGFQVGYPTMVNISIGLLQSPDIWIRRKSDRHVLMHLFLQIDSDFAITADQYIGTDADLSGYIT